MKKAILILLAVLLCGCTSVGEQAREAEILVVNVGKADAIIVRVDEDYYLIDAATEEKWGVVRAALREVGVEKLKGVFATHTDKDHVGGLEYLAESGIPVETWYASKYFVDVKEEKHPAVKAAKIRGQKVTFLSAGDTVDGVFTVVGPTQLMQDKDNNNSLVMILKTASGSVFFAGDMEYPQETTVLSEGASLKADVLKVGNHADDDTTSAGLIEKVGAKTALISTSSWEKPETPDPDLVRRLEASGAEVFYTEYAELGIRVTMNDSGIQTAYAAWNNASPVVQNVYIASLDPANDVIVLENRNDFPVSLENWYLYSDKGKEMLFFDASASIPANGRLTIGTKSTENVSFDIFWDDKNVINDKKQDKFILYDECCRAVCAKTANEGK